MSCDNENCKDAVFFFQAEDGIRDVAVTGVQTCALPILITIPSDKLASSKSPIVLRSRSPTARASGMQGPRQVGVSRAGCSPNGEETLDGAAVVLTTKRPHEALAQHRAGERSRTDRPSLGRPDRSPEDRGSCVRKCRAPVKIRLLP